MPTNPLLKQNYYSIVNASVTSNYVAIDAPLQDEKLILNYLIVVLPDNTTI